MRLNTTSWGAGPRTAVLVHGLGQSGPLWHDFAEPLVASGEWTVLAVDLRGHGDSPRAESYSVAEFAADLAETAPAGPDLVVGHSLGGAVLAAAVPRLRPRRVLHLDPGFRVGLPTEGLRARLFWAAPVVALAVVALARRVRQGEPVRSAANEERATRAARRFDHRMISAVYREVAFRPPVPTAPQVPTTVLLSGEGDTVVPPELAAELADLGWDVRRLPAVGHDFWLEDPTRTTNALQDLF